MQQPENISILVVNGPYPSNENIAYYTIINHNHNEEIQLWSVTGKEEDLEWDYMQTFDNMDASLLYIENNIAD